MVITTPFGTETVEEPQDEYTGLEHVSEVSLVLVGKSAVIVAVLYMLYLLIGGH